MREFRWTARAVLITLSSVENFIDSRAEDFRDLHCEFERWCVARGFERDDGLPRNAHRFGERLLRHLAMLESQSPNLVIDWLRRRCAGSHASTPRSNCCALRAYPRS